MTAALTAALSAVGWYVFIAAAALVGMVLAVAIWLQFADEPPAGDGDDDHEYWRDQW